MSKLISVFSDWTKLLDSHPLVILDVGANDLGTTCAFKSLFPCAYIHAFEPDIRAINNGRARLAQIATLAKRITFHECAVGKFDGLRDFYPSNGHSPEMGWYDSGYDLSGSLLAPIAASHPGLETVYFERPVEVQCITLNSWVRKFRPRKIDLIWMDVQGAELEVIQGGGLAVRMAKWIYLECMETKIYEGQPNLEAITQSLPYHRLYQSFQDGNYLFKRFFD